MAGTNNQLSRKWQPFRKARAFVRKLGLKNNLEWRCYVRGEIKGLPKKPDDIPSNPNFVYMEQGWTGYGDSSNLELIQHALGMFPRGCGAIVRLPERGHLCEV